MGSSRLRRAPTLSLRKVIDSTAKLSKRSSMFGSGTSRTSSTDLLRGPEQFVDEDTTSPVASEKRMSFSSLRASIKLNKSPINQGSPLSKSDSKNQRMSIEYDTPSRPSSPIPIRHDSPPPSISFDIEAGCPLTTSVLEGIGQAPILFTEQLTARPEQPSFAMEGIKVLKSEEHTSPLAEHVPRRGSNDHWKMRKVSRRLSIRTINPLHQVTAATDSPCASTDMLPKEAESTHSNASGASVNATEDTELVDAWSWPIMPGIAVADDPFQDDVTVLHKSPPQANHTPSSPTYMDAATQSPACHGSVSWHASLGEEHSRLLGALRRPSSGHVDRVTGKWVSHDPFAPVIDPRLGRQLSWQTLSGNDSVISAQGSLRVMTPPAKSTFQTSAMDSFESDITRDFAKSPAPPESEKEEATTYDSDFDTRSLLETQEWFYSSDDSDGAVRNRNVSKSILSRTPNRLTSMQNTASNGPTSIDAEARQAGSPAAVAALSTQDQSPKAKRSSPFATSPSKRVRSSGMANIDIDSPSKTWLADLQKKHAERQSRYSDVYRVDHDKENIPRPTDIDSDQTSTGLQEPWHMQRGPTPESPISRADSANIIPVCAVCGERDDHLCPPGFTLDETSFPPIRKAFCKSDLKSEAAFGIFRDSADIPVCAICGGPDDHFCRPNLALDLATFPPLRRASHRADSTSEATTSTDADLPADSMSAVLTDDQSPGTAQTTPWSQTVQQPWACGLNKRAAMSPLSGNHSPKDALERFPLPISRRYQYPDDGQGNSKVVGSILSTADNQNANTQNVNPDSWESLKTSLWHFLP